MNEKTINIARKFKGRLISIDLIHVRLKNGRKARREIVRHPGAVAALCRRPDGKFVFVRQFRKPLERNILEIVAGTREPGESPAVCARREILEETGYKAVLLRRLGSIYSAPGFCDERIEIYFAEVIPSVIKGRADHDEDISVFCFDARKIEIMLASGKIIDAKTLAAWTLYKHRRGNK
jgi:ADP-ribose pyrophosphatase